MKTLRILSLLTLIAFVSKAQIPNASFENWYSYSLGEYPNGWMTSDSVAKALGGQNNVYKGTDAADGQFSMHLKSVSVGFTNGPGVATNGIVQLQGATFAFSGGSADNVRHRFLEGQFRYIPTNPNDEGRITVLLTRNPSGTRDTVAMGIQNFSGTTNTYSPFLLTMVYDDYVNNPDTCLIIIQSSRGIADPNLGLGTELIVDTLMFSGTVGIEEASDIVKSVNVYPSPAQTKININVELKKKVNMSCVIYDLNGKQVMSLQSVDEKQSIDISGLAKGNYILKLMDDKNQPLATKNFVKE
jgi:hypothetical protein